jgi:hypothetical protein
MTTVDDRMPTKDLEVEVREPAWSHQGSLGSARATGALVRDVRGRRSAHGCTWVSQAVSRAAGAHLYDVSARLRFGRYQMKSGRSATSRNRSN